DGNRTPVSFLSGGQPGSPLRLSDGGTRRVDVIFPLLHGPDGEDGAIQGLARLVDLPCVSAGILGSAVGMDKDVSKRLLRDAGLSVAPFEVLFGDGVDTDHLRCIEERLDYPLFVKPANLGSSVGVSKATQRDELKAALRLAFQFEEKVLVEQAIVGREMECSILGNRDPMVSLPGEVVVDEGFYTYERKYIDENGATLIIPAEIDDTATKRLQQTALTTFTTLEGRGMARVDMFLLPSGEVFVNEVNTIPGFTKNSMYPKLWEASGVSYTQLLDRLIALAVEEFQRWRSRRVTR
ncbi:MAG: D-alanine--D-alanine ligase, partial [Firmicutes bacterium]|nr:D-alanine--D-alanine ligase [Bacillota bacterium]